MRLLKTKALSLLLALGIFSSVWAVPVYYSVGTSTADLKNASNITVSGTTATFTAAQPNNVGVGDQISYGTAPDTCYITGRTSSTVYSVATKVGGNPTARTTVTVNSIKRAFNSLASVPAGARDGGHLGTGNLVTGGFILHIACYADGEDAVTLAKFEKTDWPTGSSNYIRIFTPYLTSQVGISQRHSGTWTTSGYRLRDTNGSYGLYLLPDYVHVEGLQVKCDIAGGIVNYGIAFENTTGCKVEYCIIRGDTTNAGAANTTTGGIYAYRETSFGAYCNIIYDFRGTVTSWGGGIVGYDRITIYGNTIYGCRNGIKSEFAAHNVKNNIVQKCGAAYSTSFNEEANNISDQASSLNATNSKNSVTVAFEDSTATPRNLHLKSTDTQAKDAGATLSSYYTLDIDGTTRSGTWDIGADEVVDVTAPTNVGCSTPADGATGVSTTPTLTALTAVDETNGSGLHSSGAYYFELATNTAFTTGTQNSGWQSGTTWVPSALSTSTTYYWRVKARDNAGNASSQCGHTADVAGYGSFATTGTSAEKDLNIYYSVGTSASALYSANASASSKGVMILASAAANNIGVGDEIRVGSSRYYIRRRDNETTFRFQNSAANSGTPGDTNITFSSQSITIYRAFNCLDSAVNAARAGTLNRASDASHLNTTNLTTNSNILHIACYGDGADAVKTTVDGWTTGASGYIRIYTPTASNEVGISQRHNGKWKSTAYYLSTGTPSAVRFTINESYVRVDGIQMDAYNASNTWQDGFVVNNGATSNIRISNCILKGPMDASTGIGVNGAGNTYIWNNILYDWYDAGGANGIGFWYAGATNAWAYNNTLYNCYFGINGGSATGVVLKNNLVYNSKQGTEANYGTSGSFTGTNNLSGPNTHTDATMPATNKRDGVNVTFIDSANDDFRLSNGDAGAKEYGTGLSGDASLPFSTDLTGSTRQGTWDIGASEAASPVNIYYSVGTRTSSLYSNQAQADNGSLALYYPASDSVGVGDEVRVGSARYYICKRYSGYGFDIQRSALGGGTPGATDINFPLQDITIYRAFNCLDSAVYAGRAGTLNRASDASHLNTANLVTGNYILNFPCYADGPQTVVVYVDGWTTGANNYVRVYAPYSATDVGFSQRHSGKWDANKFNVSALKQTGYSDIFGVGDVYVRLDGLQVEVKSTETVNVNGIGHWETANAGEYWISNCIVKNSWASNGWNGITPQGNVAVTVKMWNNIVYDFKNGGAGFHLDATNYTFLAYNNTVYNCAYGFRRVNGAVTCKNNVVQKCSDGFNGTITETYSVTDLAEGLGGTGSDNSKTVAFVDSNATPRDLHIKSTDTEAKDAGTTASDANITFTTDIDGNTRSGTWDIGADESYTAPAAIYYSVGTTATALYSGTGSANSGTLTITTSSASNTIGLGDEVRQGTNEYYIRSRSSSTSFGIQTPTGGTSITFSDGAISIYRAFNSLSAAEAGATGANYLTTADLVAGNYQLNFACYGDGADVTGVTVDGYTTGGNNYIRIFTPTAATEVGTTQRHAGTWAASNVYTLAYNGTSQALAIADEYVRVEGLQISTTTAAAGGPNGIYFNPGASPNDIRVGYNIIKGILSASATSAEGIQCNASGTYRIYNNIVYDFTDPSNDHTGIAFGAGATVTAYVYNNTVQGSTTGIARTVGTIIAKNNLTQSCTDGFNGTFDGASDYNASDVASDAPGSHSKNGVSVSFINAASDNFHLQSTDTVARRSGTDLSGDPYLPFSDDVDTKTRFSTWDIGADQYWDAPGLAVAMDAFFAKGGDGNDTISWRTQSEKDNYGFNIFRRIKPEWWVAKMGSSRGVQLNARTDLDTRTDLEPLAGNTDWKAKIGKTPVSEPTSSDQNSQLMTDNARLTDKFGNDTTWKQVNYAVIPGAKGGRSVGPRSYRIIDYGVENGITYEYTIEDIDYDNTRIRHGIAEATPNKRMPGVFALHPNYPNPFNPITIIQYDLPKTCRVDISVFDLRGRKIVTLVAANQAKDPGFYNVAWTGKDAYNRPVASGVYFCRMQTENFVRLRRMTLLK